MEEKGKKKKKPSPRVVAKETTPKDIEKVIVAKAMKIGHKVGLNS